jgi:NADH-quinone oxidoreductase subunit L
MFLAAGVGAFGSAIFHLMTHAFFKALLFLAAGSIMHALSGELDLRYMGGLRHKLPITYRTFLIATLAICGIFPFAGFFSKDAVLLSAWMSGGPILWALGAVAAFMTAFYMFRAFFLAFWGESRLTPQAAAHLHESPPIMTWPLQILAALSVVGGLVGVPMISGGNVLGEWLAPAFAGGAPHPHVAPVLELSLMGLALSISALGILLAWRFYVLQPELPAWLSGVYPHAADLISHKYYVDEAVSYLIVEPVKRGSTWLWRWIDEFLIDGAVNGAGRLTVLASKGLRLAQTGYVQNYALGILAGAVAVLFWLVIR